MAASVTIQTGELTLTKRLESGRLIDEALVVDLIVRLVDAYDAGHTYKNYNVREHLRKALE